MDDKEQEIIALLRQGDNRGYRYIYDAHYALLCKLAAAMLHDDFLAQAVVDDAIFHLYEIRETLAITTSLRSYLGGAVRNRCLNHLKAERARREVPLSAAEPEEAAPQWLADARDEPLARLLAGELEREVQLAVARLPAECREVFRRSRVEQQQHEEIAAALHISVNTVKYHIKNALAALRRALDGYL
ncbi:MAG: RNA polymerase sigma-70 factor [Prevotellaceae bacterium]|jgi:RNA polymerase sigma-70 factor (ECF subfamily)|nr:RNA polymerase sigma-70 factor [Prevotellaceae bacterium]